MKNVNTMHNRTKKKIEKMKQTKTMKMKNMIMKEEDDDET